MKKFVVRDMQGFRGMATNTILDAFNLNLITRKSGKPIGFGKDYILQLIDELPIEFYNWVDLLDKDERKHSHFMVARFDNCTLFLSWDNYKTLLLLDKDDKVLYSSRQSCVFTNKIPRNFEVEYD